MGLVAHLELCDDVVGSPRVVASFWDQGETVQTGLEGEDHAVLDRASPRSYCGVRDDGIAKGVVSFRVEYKPVRTVGE
jgi:hypothetical protein